MLASMTRTEKVCAAVVVAYFGPLLLLALYLVLNQIIQGHGLGAAEMFISPRSSTSSW